MSLDTDKWKEPEFSSVLLSLAWCELNCSIHLFISGSLKLGDSSSINFFGENILERALLEPYDDVEIERWPIKFPSVDIISYPSMVGDSQTHLLWDTDMLVLDGVTHEFDEPVWKMSPITGWKLRNLLLLSADVEFRWFNNDPLLNSALPSRNIFIETLSPEQKDELYLETVEFFKMGTKLFFWWKDKSDLLDFDSDDQ